MRRQLNFLETSKPEGTAPVWPVLDKKQRAEAIAILVRMIAKMTTTPAGSHPAIAKDQDHE